MKINWKGHGTVIHGNYVLDWYRRDGSMHYHIWNKTTGAYVLFHLVLD